jgi:hypothetical protein
MMEYIIKESQFSILVENTRTVLFQDLIDSNLAYIRKECEEGVEYVGVLSDESCEQLEKLEKIEVTSADWVKVKHSNRPKEENYMSVRIMVYYSSIQKYGNFDADDLAYELEKSLRRSTGMPLILNYDTTNTNTSFEW